jgi:hypothetical protein
MLKNWLVKESLRTKFLDQITREGVWTQWAHRIYQTEWYRTKEIVPVSNTFWAWRQRLSAE